MGPLHIGDTRAFAITTENDPYRVDLLIRYPDGSEVVFATYSESLAPAPSGATRQLRKADVPSFEQSGTHTSRWNIYAEFGDAETSEAPEEEFLVYPTAFSSPFATP